MRWEWNNYKLKNPYVIFLINLSTWTRKRTLRYWFIMTFAHHYLFDNLKKRKGACKECGRCCGNHCPYKDKETNLCKVYNNRPQWCHQHFPVDKISLELAGLKGICGFYWDDE